MDFKTLCSLNVYTQVTHLTQEMDSHATPLLGMIKVYFYIVLNFPSKPKKAHVKFGLPLLRRTKPIQDGCLSVSWA